MKIFVIRRQWWTTAGCLCIAAAMFWVVSHPAAIGAAGAARQLPIYCVEVPEEEEKKVAISFDAAWGDVRLRHLIMNHHHSMNGPCETVPQGPIFHFYLSGAYLSHF